MQNSVNHLPLAEDPGSEKMQMVLSFRDYITHTEDLDY
jgi:hypothetical protein